MDETNTGRIYVIALLLTTAVSLGVAFYSLSNGQFTIFQNLFYIPIIIACFYYQRKGFIISLLLTGAYFVLFASHTTNPVLIGGALVRVVLFILIAGVITYLAVRQHETEELVRQTLDERLAANEQLSAAEEEIRFQIEELKASHQFLVDEKERFLALFETANDAIFLHEIDLDGMPGLFLEVNGRACRSLGYTRDELLRLTVIDIAGEKARREAGDRMDELFRNGSAIFESDQKRKDGTTFPVEVSSRLMRRGETNLIISVVRDITERKAFEEALRRSEEEKATVLDAMPVMLAYINADLTVRYANRVSADSVGQKQSDLIGRSCYEIWHGRTTRCDECPVVRSMEVGAIEEGEIRIPDGRIFHLKGCPVYDDSGNITGSIEFGIDITEQKAAEDALHLTNRKLQILSSITRHDILNDIMAAQGFLEFAEEMSVDPKQARYLKEVIKATSSIQRHIEFTREYDKLGVAEPIWLDLSEQIGKGGDDRIPIRNECNRISLLADPMLEKVFSNLMDNTIRHAEGATRIAISCRLSNDELTIIWEDDGVGIPDDQKERIFSRGVGKNTGFGLFLTREILEITGITISETGRYGEGARFEIRVPSGKFKMIEVPDTY